MITAEDKLKHIAEALRKETLEPAKKEAEMIIGHAKREAERIIAEAHQQSKAIAEKNRQQLEQEKNVFETSLQQAAKQGIEALRQAVEQRFFREGLAELLAEQSADPKLLAKLIDSIAENIDTDIAVLIPASVKPEEVTALLGKRVEDVSIGEFAGGVQVKLVGKDITLDVSDKALQELLVRYVRRDFREKFFQV